MSHEPASQVHRVLVTGAAGAIGQPVCHELLRRGHGVRGFDRRPTPGVEDAVVAEIDDHAAVLRAAEGCDTIIHLAATRDDAPFLDALLKPNVAGLFNVMDAARQVGAKRVVLASTMQTVSGLRGQREDSLLTADDAAPTNHYALTKIWAERMGEMYARCYGLSVIAVRIGWFLRSEREAARMEHHKAYDTYFSYPDAARFFSLCVEAPTDRVKFAILFGVSKHRDRQRVDHEPSRQLIGYEPRDVFPEGLGFPWPSPAASAPA